MAGRASGQPEHNEPKGDKNIMSISHTMKLRTPYHSLVIYYYDDTINLVPHFEYGRAGGAVLNRDQARELAAKLTKFADGDQS